MTSKKEGGSRRGFLKGSVGLVAGAAAAQLLPGQVAAQQNATNAGMLDRLRQPSGRPILLKDGIILSMDQQVGDFEKGSVLIQDKKIVSVGANVPAPAGALVVDAARMIVLPGFINTHHHQAQAPYRSLLSDSIILEVADKSPGPKVHYGALQQFGPFFTPDDAHIAELVASLGQINAGVTTGIDIVGERDPATVDAAIDGLKKSGRRTLYAYPLADAKLGTEMTRLRKQHFSSDDQLVTLAASPGNTPELWQLARSFDAPICVHFWRRGVPLEPLAKVLGPDAEFIHFTLLPDTYWKMVADAGMHISIASAIDMQMRQGTPVVQKALDFGIRPSLSSDVECNMSGDMFTLMRAAFLSQRQEINARVNAGETNVQPLITCRQIVEFATRNGAWAPRLRPKIGTLTPGKEADIIMLATDRINVAPLNNVPGAIVTLMDTSNVENVFIAGKVMKWQGRLVGVDTNQINRQIEKSRDGIFSRAKYSRSDLFGTCCPGPETPGGK